MDRGFREPNVNTVPGDFRWANVWQQTFFTVDFPAYRVWMAVMLSTIWLLGSQGPPGRSSKVPALPSHQPGCMHCWRDCSSDQPPAQCWYSVGRYRDSVEPTSGLASWRGSADKAIARNEACAHFQNSSCYSSCPPEAHWNSVELPGRHNQPLHVLKDIAVTPNGKLSSTSSRLSSGQK